MHGWMQANWICGCALLALARCLGQFAAMAIAYALLTVQLYARFQVHSGGRGRGSQISIICIAW